MKKKRGYKGKLVHSLLVCWASQCKQGIIIDINYLFADLLLITGKGRKVNCRVKGCLKGKLKEHCVSDCPILPLVTVDIQNA